MKDETGKRLVSSVVGAEFLGAQAPLQFPIASPVCRKAFGDSHADRRRLPVAHVQTEHQDNQSIRS